MRRFTPRLCLSLLLLLAMASGLAHASETLAQVVADQQLHGYHSTQSALLRLRQAGDVPGPDAPVNERLHYQTVLLAIATDGVRLDQIRANLDSLQKMDADGECPPCRFYALLAQATLEMNEVSVSAARPYLDRAAALLPEIADPLARENLLAKRGALGMV